MRNLQQIRKPKKFSMNSWTFAIYVCFMFHVIGNKYHPKELSKVTSSLQVETTKVLMNSVTY